MVMALGSCVKILLPSSAALKLGAWTVAAPETSPFFSKLPVEGKKEEGRLVIGWG
jgi:hypothetical protein